MSKSFIVKAGYTHSSNNDKLYVNIKAGEKYFVRHNGTSVYIRYSDWSYKEVVKNEFYETAEKDIISFGVYVGNGQEDRKIRISIYFDSAYELYKVPIIESQYNNLNDRVSYLSIGKNMIGRDPNIYYPVFIEAGQSITWSYSDGSVLTSRDFYIYLYDQNKTQINYYNATEYSGLTKRTITVTQNTYYIRPSKILITPIQVELGKEATEYEPYFDNTKMLHDTVNNILLNNFYCVKIDVNAGTSHSSTKDKIKIDLNVDEQYYIYLEVLSGNVSDRIIQLYEYSNNSGTLCGNINTKNSFIKRTALINADYISLFISSGSEAISINFYAVRANTYFGMLSKSINETKTDIQNIISSSPHDTSESVFSVASGKTHSSTNHKINMNIESGEYINVIYYGTNKRAVALYSYSNGVSTSLLNQFPEGCVYKVKLKTDADSLGLFVDSGNTDVSVKFIAFKDNTLYKTLNDDYDKQFLLKLLNAKRKANSYKYTDLNSPEIFTVSHFSDIHGSTREVKRIQAFKEKFGEYIDDVICTGDMVVDKFSDGMSFWNNNSDGTILTCIGNHDSFGGNNWTNVIDQSTLYETYIQPYEENWNAQIVSGHTWYHKNYDDKKVCLVVIDGTIFNSEEQNSQIAWLTSVLNTARTNEYSVIGAVHFPSVQTTSQIIDSNFSSMLHKQGTLSSWAWYTYHVNVMDAVQDFIDAGGDFICWLSGHTHFDIINYDVRYPKQLFITISCATSSSVFEEKIRDHANNSDMVLNTVCVDTVRKYIKILRYGAEYDDLLRHTSHCIIKYDANPPVVLYEG